MPVTDPGERGVVPTHESREPAATKDPMSGRRVLTDTVLIILGAWVLLLLLWMSLRSSNV